VVANTMIRERTAVYVASRARELRKLLARGEGTLAERIDLDSLKMKQRDALEEVLGTWLEGVHFEVERMRDERLRAYYRDRYDHRRNMLDWDYSMGMAATAPIIHRVHFREWRLTGLAYEVRDAAYDTPNRTLASSAAGRQHGSSVLKRGFWGDIANSPYPAFGVQCDNARFFERRSDQMVKTACDVAYYNVVGWFHRLETGRPFTLVREDFDDFMYGASVGSGGLVKGFLRSDQSGPRPLEQQLAASRLDELIEDEAEDAARAASDATTVAAAEDERVHRELARRRVAALPKFRLVLHTGRSLDLFSRASLTRSCHHVHIASHAAHLLAAPLAAVLAEHASLAVESARFLCEVQKEAKERLALKLLELGARAGLEPATPAERVDGVHSSLVVFGFDAAWEQARKAAALERYGPSISASEIEPAAARASDAGPAPPVSQGGAAPGAPARAAATAPAASGLGAGVALRSCPARASAEHGTPPHATGDGPGEQSPALSLTWARTALPPRCSTSTGTPAARICAITGLAAKYRDPLTGCYYANAEAFKELRAR
jgi:dynein assembly factor 3